MRLSDPFVLLTKVMEDSYLNDFGLKAGDAIITVDGEDFDTLGEFAALTKRNKDMVCLFVLFLCADVFSS